MSLILAPSLPMRAPHWLAGTRRLSSRSTSPSGDRDLPNESTCEKKFNQDSEAYSFFYKNVIRLHLFRHSPLTFEDS
jgi:hypothetical protein